MNLTDQQILFKVFSPTEHFLIVGREEKKAKNPGKGLLLGEREVNNITGPERQIQSLGLPRKPRSQNLMIRETQRKDVPCCALFKTFARFLCCSKL